jgi:cytidine deaminase
MADDSGNSGIHAEHDAIQKLLPLRKTRKKSVNITLLVVRLSNRNKLQTSKPCVKCLKMMKTLPQKLGYNIKHIYYSDDNILVKTTICELEQEKPHITGFSRWNKLEL